MGKAQPVVPGVDPFEKLKHQVRFLHGRGLASVAMADLNRQLWLLERLAGGNRRNLDSHLLDRLNRELGEATLAQLRATGLLYEWLDEWEARDATASSADLETVPVHTRTTTVRQLG